MAIDLRYNVEEVKRKTYDIEDYEIRYADLVK